jgi:hypothetical protein
LVTAAAGGYVGAAVGGVVGAALVVAVGPGTSVADDAAVFTRTVDVAFDAELPQAAATSTRAKTVVERATRALARCAA